MSEAPDTRDEWQKLWDEYTKSLTEWGRAYESVQRAGAQLQQSFGRVMEKASKESSTDTMKKFGKSWQEAAGAGAPELARIWQKALEESTADAYGRFVQACQKSLTDTGMEQMKSYGDMMKRFAETWNKMWPKS